MPAIFGCSQLSNCQWVPYCVKMYMYIEQLGPGKHYIILSTDPSAWSCTTAPCPFEDGSIETPTGSKYSACTRIFHELIYRIQQQHFFHHFMGWVTVTYSNSNFSTMTSWVDLPSPIATAIFDNDFMGWSDLPSPIATAIFRQWFHWLIYRHL